VLRQHLAGRVAEEVEEEAVAGKEGKPAEVEVEALRAVEVEEQAVGAPAAEVEAEVATLLAAAAAGLAVPRRRPGRRATSL
jgi:hypothetical protein